jgi:hypothetical protein
LKQLWRGKEKRERCGVVGKSRRLDEQKDWLDKLVAKKLSNDKKSATTEHDYGDSRHMMIKYARVSKSIRVSLLLMVVLFLHEHCCWD